MAARTARRVPREPWPTSIVSLIWGELVLEMCKWKIGEAIARADLTLGGFMGTGEDLQAFWCVQFHPSTLQLPSEQPVCPHRTRWSNSPRGRPKRLAKSQGIGSSPLLMPR